MSGTPTPTLAAVRGILLVLPFVGLNAVVGNRIEPFFSLIRPGVHTSRLEYVLLFAVVILIPVGAFLTAQPMLRRGTDGKRRFCRECRARGASVHLLRRVIRRFGIGHIQVRRFGYPELRLEESQRASWQDVEVPRRAQLRLGRRRAYGDHERQDQWSQYGYAHVRRNDIPLAPRCPGPPAPRLPNGQHITTPRDPASAWCPRET